ncbi:hypothetical protein OKW21_006174 [Catalinimonas alkaloidigena]|uniref:GNAT family N-acetyltransferase n=1 Tax=Catalinimonas alkaloidigena TaxID=1075417 RepID=UPI00240598EC|nr:GNAT family N-acetyltransferase [Catalinimonas alkaloidigena]MDF9800911.1 hypothetical protein [Catalinimonas alkaloidigena]
MENLRFVSKKNSDQYPLQAENYLYNSSAYLQLKASRFAFLFTFYALKKNIAIARIHFFIKESRSGEKEAISLPESPFGSLEYRGELRKENLTEFIHYIKAELSAAKVKQVSIKDCINAYRAGSNLDLQEILIQNNFKEESSLTNHHIAVDPLALEQKMHKMERKRLRKARKAGFRFKEEPLSSLSYYYRFLQECRQEKGWHLSMSYADALKSVQQLPEAYRIFAVYHGDECIAASLSVVVNERILYDFYHDAKAAFKSWSPVVFLVEGIYQYCQQNGLRLLDLGTSQSTSLQLFKQHLGGIASYKNTYQLQL